MREQNESLQRDAHRLLQAGGLLFLLGLLTGFAVPKFAVPRLGLSAHLLGIMQGLFLMVAGLLWPKLKITRPASRIGIVLAIYAALAAYVSNVLAAFWGAGNTMMPIAAGAARGSAAQEGVIKFLLITASLSLVATAVLILWGLRTPPHAESGAPEP